MTVKIYTIKDELTDRYMQPLFLENEDVAKRFFKTQVNSIEMWKQNASDYSLYEIGTFDDATGTIVGINPTKIVGGRSVVTD